MFESTKSKLVIILSASIVCIVIGISIYYASRDNRVVRGNVGDNSCGFELSFSNKSNLCVEVPPKIVSFISRRMNLDDNDIPMKPKLEDQSMKFYCRNVTKDGITSTLESEKLCEKHCNADNIYIKQVFLVEDEFDYRKYWSGGHIRVVVDEKPQIFYMDYSIGCKDAEDFLAQDFTDQTKFNCGLSEIGYDLYYKKDSVRSNYCNEELKIDGDSYCYATMSNLNIGTFLQNTIKRVIRGELCPGIHTQSFPKYYDNIVPLCVAEYKVNFVITETWLIRSGLSYEPIDTRHCNATSYEIANITALMD